MFATIRTLPSNPLTRTALALLVCGLAIGASSAVRAGSSAEASVNVNQIEVKYKDLDLTKREGAVALYTHIASAARQVCPAITSLSARTAAEGRACVRDAISRAVKEVNSPQLAEVEAARHRSLS